MAAKENNNLTAKDTKERKRGESRITIHESRLIKEREDNARGGSN